MLLCTAASSRRNCSTPGLLLLLLLSISVVTCSSMKLTGQRILITGAGRGIGRAIAQVCYHEGATVALTARTKSELEETASSLLHQFTECSASEKSDESGILPLSLSSSSRISIHVADITVMSDVERMVQETVDRWGGIDILINNAGRSQSTKGLLSELSSEDFIQLLDLNVVAVHRVTSTVLKRAAPRQIINISSRAGKIGIPNMSLYCASKFALEGLTAALAVELEDKNIRVNSISPGMVDTTSFPKQPGTPGVRTPESIADGLFLLLQTDVTGHYLHVDELDEVRRMGLDDHLALKPIKEPDFRQALSFKTK